MKTRLNIYQPQPNPSGIDKLLAAARQPDDLLSRAVAGAIAMALRGGQRPLIRGLSEARFQELIRNLFPRIALTNGGTHAPVAADSDEFEDLLQLLLDSRAADNEEQAWLCHAIASAAMGDNHLWQDMGLPHRHALSGLMRHYFPALAASNVGDMKWKKFFYRQLCLRADIPICKSPHCGECIDYSLCFEMDDRD